jgi:prepilin signal peptidase PulO-like enzyme (type II secretory pathway)
MEILLLIMVFVLGLCCGSFVNMLIYRTAVQYDLISNFQFSKSNKKRSFCDGCGKQLRWYENVPVISWLIQRGKTRCCGKKLSMLYPIVEIATGILFLINFQFSIFNFQSNLNSFNFQFLIQLLLGFVIITFLVFSAVFDLKYMILPDFSTVILTICATIFLFVEIPDLAFLQWKVLSAIISFGFLYFLYLITKKKGMGFGDVKLAFFMGLFLGYPKIIVAMYFAFVVGALVGLILMLFKKAGKKTKISFGPFLILGTIVAWFWGDFIIKFLMSNF